jgi:hypothetical protein
MINDKSQSGYGLHIHRVKALHTIAAVFAAVILLAISFLLAAGLLIAKAANEKNCSEPGIREILRRFLV